MNILIILYFVLIFTSIVVLLYPRKLAVRIAGINRYDLISVPFRYVVWVFVIGSLILSVSIGLLIFELKDMLFPVPSYIQQFLDWING